MKRTILAMVILSMAVVLHAQKFGHVTYFFNGNKSGKFDDNLEDYIEIPSDIIPLEERTWMMSDAITDKEDKAIINILNT